MNESKTDTDYSQNTTSVYGTDGLGNRTEYGTVITIPKQSDWTATVADINWCPREGQEPKWIHRKMQELFFGIKWRKKS
jgi:hypothetical protein